MRKVILFSVLCLVFGFWMYSLFGGAASTGIDQQLIDMAREWYPGQN